MTTILAIDTATDACSVALYDEGEYRDLYEVIPRQHSRRLLPMLQQLLPSGKLREQGIDAIAYGSGPGSFTGLRIAASAVQGLAFANDLPALPVSTLAGQVQTALREQRVAEGDHVLSMLDARINEVYWQEFQIRDGLAECSAGVRVTSPGDVRVETDVAEVYGVGSGFNYLETLDVILKERLTAVHVDVLPSARDLVPLALALFSRGHCQRPNEVLPVYVREEVSWKKLSEQGKP